MEIVAITCLHSYTISWKSRCPRIIGRESSPLLLMSIARIKNLDLLNQWLKYGGTSEMINVVHGNCHPMKSPGSLLHSIISYDIAGFVKYDFLDSVLIAISCILACFVMEMKSPHRSSGDNTELSRVLRQYDLIQYEERLKANAFDTWEAVMGMTETDMKELSISLGHRRKLQRAIHEYSLPSTSEETFDSWPKRIKRTYRRRPLPDHNAPVKPKTAYVLFGEHIREKDDGNGLSFAEMAKQTGRLWKELPQEERTNLWEKPAMEKRREYDEELKYYKMDENYHIYQAYLKDFKAKAKQPKRDSTLLSDDHVFRSAYFDHVSAGSSSREQSGVHSAIQSEIYQGEASNSSRIAADMESSPRQHALPADEGMQEVNIVFDSLGVNNELTRVDAYPPENITTIAVEAFLFGTGSLIYLWSAAEALHLVEAVYHSNFQTAPVDAIEIFAMAAVGSYCDGVAMIEPYQKKFMHYFIHMMSSHSDVAEFRRMRLLVCLATCRFVDSIESARTLMCRC